MSNFISTETAMLVSLLGNKMPNLIKYIIEYSTPKTAKNTTPKLTKIVSAQQIQEASQHSNTIISQTLSAVGSIQAALNATNNQIHELLKHRGMVENTLVTLLTIKNKEEE